ncbi:MAG: hypothetical protein AAFV53_27130 [Myxococcota bacterium]
MKFIEICAGSAAVSLRLLGNKQPPCALQRTEQLPLLLEAS